MQSLPSTTTSQHFGMFAVVSILGFRKTTYEMMVIVVSGRDSGVFQRDYGFLSRDLGIL